MSLGPVLPVEEVAKAFPGLSVQAVRAMLRKGEVRGTKLRGRWWVREADILAKFQDPDHEARSRVIRVLQRARARPRRLAVIAPLVAPRTRSV